MIFGHYPATSGRRGLVVIGLSGENVTRLAAGEPILTDLARLRLPPQPVVILYGRTEADIAEHLLANIAGVMSTSPVTAEVTRPQAHAALVEALRPYVSRDIEAVATAALCTFWPAPAGGFTCPRCARTSNHPTDLEQGYCGACRAWTSDPAGLRP